VRGIDPETGHYFDDTRRYIDAADLTGEAREAIYSGNVRTVFPRVDAHLAKKGM
jgi:4-oxalmesaconate hydratase